VKYCGSSARNLLPQMKLMWKKAWAENIIICKTKIKLNWRRYWLRRRHVEPRRCVATRCGSIETKGRVVEFGTIVTAWLYWSHCLNYVAIDFIRKRSQGLRLQIFSKFCICFPKPFAFNSLRVVAYDRTAWSNGWIPARIKYVNTFKHNFDHNEKLDLLLYIYNYGSKLEKLLHMQKWNKLPWT
jgi:hypothetical protein